MVPIPLPLRKHLATLPRMRLCGRRDEGGCSGRIEYHHAIQRANKRLQEAWCLVGACTEHHRGKLKDDKKWRLIAYRQAEEADFAKYPKSREAWEREFKYLSRLFSDIL